MKNQTLAAQGLLASLLCVASAVAVLYVLFQFIPFLRGETSSPVANTIDAGVRLVESVVSWLASNVVSGTDVAADDSFMHMIGTGLYYYIGAGVCVIFAATVGMVLFAASRMVEIGPRRLFVEAGEVVRAYLA